MAIANLKLWKNGEILNARDYVYERNRIVSEVNRLSALVTGEGESVDLSVGGLNAASITLGPKTIWSPLKTCLILSLFASPAGR